MLNSNQNEPFSTGMISISVLLRLIFITTKADNFTLSEICSISHMQLTHIIHITTLRKYDQSLWKSRGSTKHVLILSRQNIHSQVLVEVQVTGM